jgi:hypothetical protein
MDPCHPPTGDALTALGVTGASTVIALAAATSEAPSSHTLRRVRMGLNVIATDRGSLVALCGDVAFPAKSDMRLRGSR